MPRHEKLESPTEGQKITHGAQGKRVVPGIEGATKACCSGSGEVSIANINDS
jgi:hypothetical protein